MKAKKLALLCTSLILTAALGVGGTFAWLTWKDSTSPNVFTLGSNLTGTITETNWNNSNGQNFVPGSNILKNPVVTNNTPAATPMNAYVAVKLTATDDKGPADITTILGSTGFADLLGTPGTWVQSTSDPSVFYYTKTVANGASTDPVFTSVKIKEAAAYADLRGFSLTVNAYMVQAPAASDEVTSATLTSTFNTAFPAVFPAATNTPGTVN